MVDRGLIIQTGCTIFTCTADGLNPHTKGEKVNINLFLIHACDIGRFRSPHVRRGGKAEVKKEVYCSSGSDCVCLCLCMCAFLLQLHSLQSQLEFQEQSMVEKSLVCRQEAKIRELETKLEYERTQIKRLEVR